MENTLLPAGPFLAATATARPAQPWVRARCAVGPPLFLLSPGEGSRMACIRAVHLGFFANEAILSLRPRAQVFQIGLWTQCENAAAAATRLPDDWRPSPEDQRFARRHGMNPNG